MTLRALRGGSIFDVQSPEDEVILRECGSEDVYRLSGRDLAGRSVVDVGACFGAFTLAAVDAGAHVWAVEPHPSNSVRLMQHIDMNDAVKAVTVTVGGIARPDVEAVAYHGDAGAAWTGPYDPNGDVGTSLAYTLDDLLNEAATSDPKTRVAMLKLDCEGAEWDALVPCDNLGLVDFVACEWHGPALTERPDLGTVGQLVDALSPSHGCEVFGEPDKGGQLYATRYPIEADDA